MPGVDAPIHTACAARTARPIRSASCSGTPSATVTITPDAGCKRFLYRGERLQRRRHGHRRHAPVAATASAQEANTGTPATCAMSVRVAVPPTMLVP